MTEQRTDFTAELLLWRHADAEDGIPDAARALTRRGLKQAKQVAEWLRPRLAQDCLILVSPAKRAQQTAAALDLPFATEPRVGLQAESADIVAAAAWPKRVGTVLVVGHQPTLGQLAACLLSGEPADWTIKKGALWWFAGRARYGDTQVILRAVISPDLL
ncbi:MAG: histidine phosphatase family protein [Betaproteobacteria bacterium]|nr:MAG: histidine phosphatase family protein [Betaproteobacteria bacterium]